MRAILIIACAVALSGCYRVQTTSVAQPEGSGVRIGLWAKTPEGCSVYVVAGSGAVDRIVVCPSEFTVAGVGG